LDRYDEAVACPAAPDVRIACYDAMAASLGDEPTWVITHPATGTSPRLP
jgi:hypothetical protein